MCAELSLSAITWMGMCAFRPKERVLAAKAAWLQSCCRRFLRMFGVRCRYIGPVPTHGLLVSNHLSYLDVLVLASVTPAIFVAKSEVKGWPVFGWFVKRAGTVFVQRERRAHVGDVTNEIQAALDSNVVVILFPEGTSSDGTTVLPLKTSLLEPAARSTQPLHVSLIQYEMKHGDPAREVCYWGDMTFFPHLLNLLGKRNVEGVVRFKEINGASSDRKELARQLHAELLRLQQAGPAAAA